MWRWEEENHFNLSFQHIITIFSFKFKLQISFFPPPFFHSLLLAFFLFYIFLIKLQTKFLSFSFPSFFRQTFNANSSSSRKYQMSHHQKMFFFPTYEWQYGPWIFNTRRFVITLCTFHLSQFLQNKLYYTLTKKIKK